MNEPLYLVGNREIRRLLGDISRQRVYQLTSRPDFPAPAATLSQGKVWRGEEVENWIRHRRRPYRPAPGDQPGPIPRLFVAPRPRGLLTGPLIPCCMHALQHAGF